MRRIICFLVINFICLTTLFGQELSIEQVCEILSELATQNFKSQLADYPGDVSIGFSVNRSEILIDYCWNGNEDNTFESDVSDICNSLVLNLGDVSSLTTVVNEDDKFIVQVQCESGDKDCISFSRNDIINYYYKLLHDHPGSQNHYDFVNIFYFSDFETQELTLKGLQYIAYELSKSNSSNKERARGFDFAEGKTIVKINLNETGGVSELPINMGGVLKMAILDSGASDVSLPESVEKLLIEKGIINEDNYLPSGMYTVADGRTILSRRFIIPKIEVEGVYVENVTCSVNESKDIILLGRAFLDAFKSWSVNNETNQLILKY